MIQYAMYHHEALGDLTIACDDSGIVGLWIAGQRHFGSSLDTDMVHDEENPVLKQTMEWLHRYFLGNPLPISALPLAPKGTAFQKQVWSALADIPYGKTSTYGAIAARVAQEQGCSHGGTRAVGGAVGRNPISIILPCHRVIGSDGNLTGYAGGIDKKIWLLEHEGVDISKLKMPRDAGMRARTRRAEEVVQA